MEIEESTIVKSPSFWGKLSRTEKILIIFAILMLAIVVILGILLISSILNFTGKKICMSATCFSNAATILQYMNDSANPCDNFYDFACGNFIEDTIIRKDRSASNVFTEMEDEITEKLLTIFEGEEAGIENQPKTLGMVKKFFKICINETLLEIQDLQPMKDLFKQVGGWPVLEGNNWDEDNFHWQNMTQQMTKLGVVKYVQYLFSIFVFTDVKENTKRRIHIHHPVLDLDRQYLIEDINVWRLSQYHELMVDIVGTFGGNKTAAEFEMKEVIKFSQRLAHFTLKREEMRNQTTLYNPKTIDEMQNTYPNILSSDFLNKVLYPDSDARLSDEHILIDSVPPFIKLLDKLLAETPKRVVANYLGWRMFRDIVFVLPKRVRKRVVLFTQIMDGVGEEKSRWRSCIGKAIENLHIASTSLFVRKFFDEEAKGSVIEMVENIRTVFNKNLNENRWMDYETKKSAYNKLRAMQTHIAYPNELGDNNLIDNYYKNLEIDETTYLKTHLNINRFNFKFDNSLLDKTVNKTEWFSHASIANLDATYAIDENSIQILANVLRGRFYSKDRPMYLNYGTIGYVIGHEMTHGFDDKGRQFNENGQLHNWWQNKTEEEFVTKANCITKQYNAYHVPEINKMVDGVQTLDENIADNGGIREAYLAYLIWLAKYGEEEMLPGVSYNTKQLFWISTAQLWCSKERPLELEKKIATDEHAPPRFRIIGPMTNFKEFSADFNCPKTAFMNREKKCRVW